MSMVRLLGLALVVGFGLRTASAGPVDGWQRKAEIRFSGYTGTTTRATLTNFPALVILGPGTISGFSYADFLSGGSNDLRFTDATGTNEIPYEVEQWNPAGNSYVWVRVPALTDANATTTSIWGYWRKASVTSPAYTTNGLAWDTNFVYVAHLGNGAALSYADSSQKRNAASPNGTAMIATNGAVGGGAGYTGANYAWMGMQDISAGGTASIWFRVTNNTPACGLIGHRNGTTSSRIYVQTTATNTCTLVYATGAVGGASPVYAPDTWHCVSATWDGSQQTAFLDGVSFASANNAFSGGWLGLLSLGNITAATNPLSASQYLTGSLDEFRASSRPRSSDWLWGEYMNMASNTPAFATYSAAQTIDLGNLPPVITNAVPTNITALSAWFNGWLASTGTSPVTVSLLWGETDGGLAFGAWQHTNVWAAGDWTEGSRPTASTTFPTANRIYFYTYYATNSGGECWPAAGTVQSLLAGEVSITAGANGAEAGPANGSFTVSRDPGATNGALTVYYTVDQTVASTASNGVDYATLPGSVVLNAGVASTTIVVQVLRDYLYAEPTETIKLDLAAGLYTIGSSGSAQITIANDPTQAVMYLQSNQDVGAGGTITGFTAPSGGTAVYKGLTSGDGSAGNPYLYRFGVGADFCGNLDLQSSKIYVNTSLGKSFTLDMGGYSITGNSGATALSTYNLVVGSPKPNIAVRNVGNVAIGAINTEVTQYGSAASGDVGIGTSAARARSVRVDGINTKNAKSGGTDTGDAGNVTVYGSNDVRIATGAGVAGNIETWAGYVAGGGGNVGIYHDGAFLAAQILSYIDRDGAAWHGTAGGTSAGSVTLNGDYSGDGASGQCLVSNILTRTAPYASVTPGSVTITGYTNVYVAGYINTENRSPSSTAGRNIAITNIMGNIRIDGVITANVAANRAFSGNVLLQCTGSIVVSNLNLSLVKYAAFDAGGQSCINGVLTGTNGVAASGLDSLGTALRARSGKKLYYQPRLNPALNVQSYTLADLAGTAGAGGRLVPQATGTIVAFQ
jgi:hypothetical protein